MTTGFHMKRDIRTVIRVLAATLVVCILLLGRIGYAEMAEKAALRSAVSRTAHHPTGARGADGKNARRMPAKKNEGRRGQRAIDPQRVRQIQAALIREKYLQGRANGVWDRRSKDAMARFQSDNGWQARVLPDSRALIRLGLGPDYSGLVNRDTAGTRSPHGGGATFSASAAQP